MDLSRQRQPQPERWDWEDLRSRCRREARRLLRDGHDAEDAVQEALSRAWRGRRSCRTPEHPIPWLLQITRNEALRLREKQQTRPAEAVAAVAQAAATGPSAESDLLDLRMDVRRALARLPSSDRALAWLRYDEDLACGSIADVLGMPEGTIKVQLHRLRSRLQGELAEDPRTR